MIDYRERNIKKIVDYFVSGRKENSYDLTLGLELEHFVVDKKTKETVHFYGEKGIAQILERISIYYDQVERFEDYIVGLGKDTIAISIEPAAQIEVSITPSSNILEIEKIYQKFLIEITPVLEEWGYCLIESGYQPRTKVDEIPLIPKKRYQYMQQYFEMKNTNGKYMMKGTASTQVSIDYFSEKDFVEKYKAAYLLLPLLSLVTDNSPIFEGELYKNNLLRAKIWEEVDEERVNIFKYLDERELTFEAYARFVYQVPLIFYEDEQKLIKTNQSAKEIYKNKEMDLKEMEHVLSMVFPDVRLKKYVEIRYADSLPIEGVLSYLAFVKGLFVEMNSLNQWIESLEIKDFEQQTIGKYNIMENGLEGIIYNRPVKELLNELFSLAKSNLIGDEKNHLERLERQLINDKILFKNKELDKLL
ncbi:glutamate-cysteine ligase family protein [Anaerosacchariphilus polymeriproducens]|uniref:glutamate--cysteine ligase n=1 Tax=Anaerosacchariphilus polymeriproducens TaxID=1812858 RepID=A0A371AYU9_9FIRM|nr:glutamate-cysteine ligase family protein [Anaerosacchariphilus polymeriproducens]RDU24737.1 hypothetical protein DWV06_04515 [Anaerosacchariphilus polymeriproducens]